MTLPQPVRMPGIEVQNESDLGVLLPGDGVTWVVGGATTPPPVVVRVEGGATTMPPRAGGGGTTTPGPLTGGGATVRLPFAGGGSTTTASAAKAQLTIEMALITIRRAWMRGMHRTSKVSDLNATDGNTVRQLGRT